MVKKLFNNVLLIYDPDILLFNPWNAHALLTSSISHAVFCLVLQNLLNVKFILFCELRIMGVSSK